MGRNKSVKNFDYNALFLDNQTDAATRLEVARSPCLSVILAAYNLVGGNLRVGHVRKHQNGGVSKVNLVTPVGLPVALIDMSSSRYSFDICFDASTGAMSSFLGTTNLRYMRSKISAGNDVGIRLINRVDENNKFFSSSIYTMIDRLVDKAMGESVTGAPSFSSPLSMDRELLTFMARYMAGEVTTLEMPNNLRALFDSMYKEFSDKRAKFKEALVSAREFVGGDKWFFMNNVNNGVILGGIGSQPMLAAVEHYTNVGRMPSYSDYNFCDVTVPFKWYPSFQDIPEQYRRELEYSLVMLKTHRGVDEMIPNTGAREFWPEMGCYSAGSVHVLHR